MTTRIATLPITAALTALLEELSAEIPDVLHETFTFACLWSDLARIAGDNPRPARCRLTLRDRPVPQSGTGFKRSFA